MTSPRDKIRDVATRTLKNLEKMDNLYAKGEEVYEVTQLINSLLGLIVFPQQEYVSIIPNIPTSELEEDGWPIPLAIGDFRQASDLNYLIKKLRNSISHHHLEYISDDNDQIVSLVLWDEYRGKVNWKAQISVSDLKQFIFRFTELLMKI